MHLGDVASWATIVGGVGVVGGGFVGGLKLLLGHMLKPLKAQLVNNGGKSMKDTLERVERKTDDGNKMLTDHLIASAAKEAEQDVRIEHLEKVR